MRLRERRKLPYYRALAGILVVFAVVLFDKAKVDDPVGATSVHLCCGIFGTICIGLFAQEGVTSLSVRNGLFFGGGFGMLGVQLIGIAAVGIFGFASTALVWLALKKTMGIRVSRKKNWQVWISGTRERRLPGFRSGSGAFDRG